MLTTKEVILNRIRKRGEASSAELAEGLGISRQAVHRQLKSLISEGRIQKIGVTRGVRYRFVGGGKVADPPGRISRRLAVAGLEEDVVLMGFEPLLRPRPRLSRQAQDITRYAFTEMLNNAIDHSNSSNVVVSMWLDAYTLHFSVRDYGIGIFRNIAERFGLPDESSAAAELLKGKRTTMKERHSGEGIFFSSKAADRLSFRSHGTGLAFDTVRGDVFLSTERQLKGTEVLFEVKRRSRRSLERIFAEFAGEEFQHRFEKTRVMVRLFEADYFSRSQARRLLAGLERFTEVRLDFKGVRILGQGFCDEVFRVFLERHGNVRIVVENLPGALRPMVEHVVDGTIKPRLTIG